MDEVLEKLRKLEQGIQSHSTKNLKKKRPEPELRIDDKRRLWIRLDSVERILGVPLPFFFSDGMLDAYKNLERKTGVFPIKELTKDEKDKLFKKADQTNV